MKPHRPPPPVRPEHIYTEAHRLSQVFTEKSTMYKDWATVSYCAELMERLAVLIPAKPCPLVGAWQGRPPNDSAEGVLWKVAGLLKFDPETCFVEPEAHRLMICAISQLLNIDDDDGWSLFSAAFTAANTGTGSANQSLQVAKLNAQEDIERGTDRDYLGGRPIYRDARRRLLVGIFRHHLCSGKVGERWISTRDAGTLIGVHCTQAATWIRAMVADGYIEKLKSDESDQPSDKKKPKPRLPKHLQAPLYRWIPS